jgi:hypothetical protein
VSDQDPGPLPELTSEQEATVRRLLAEARHDDPIPDPVAERLDRVLADLSSGSSAPMAPVVDLAARRRRRNAGGLLVAAAAVIVGGFFVGQVIDVGGPDSADDSSAGSSVARDSSSGDQDSQAAPSAPGDDAGGTQPAPEAAQASPLQLTSQNLKRDVQRQLRDSAANADLDPDASSLSQPYAEEFSCASASAPAYGVGKFFAAFYDGMPTVLALRPPEGDTQQAQVLDCGTGTPLQSVTVPAP